MSNRVLPPQLEKYADYDTRVPLTKLNTTFSQIMEDGGIYNQNALVFSPSKLRDQEARYISEMHGFTQSLSLRNLITSIDNLGRSARDIDIELRANGKSRLVFIIPKRVIINQQDEPKKNRAKAWKKKEKELETLVETYEKKLKQQKFYRTTLRKRRFWRVYMEKIARDIFQHFTGMCIQCVFTFEALDDRRGNFGIQFTRKMEIIDLRTLDHISKKHKKYIKDTEIFPGTMTIQFTIESPKIHKKKRDTLDVSSDEEYRQRKKRQRSRRNSHYDVSKRRKKR